jgi:hypothetical protein
VEGIGKREEMLIYFIHYRTTYEGAKTISPKVGASGGYYSEMHEARSRSNTLGETGKTFATHVWNDTIAILKKIVPENDIFAW